MTQWEIAKFAPSAASDGIAAAVTRDGCAIIEGLASENTLDSIERELAPHVEVTPKGDGEIMGFETKRTAGLMAGVAGMEATPVKGVPPILHRHEATTVCGTGRSWATWSK